MLRNFYSAQLINLVANSTIMYISRNKNQSGLTLQQKINDVAIGSYMYTLFSTDKLSTLNQIGFSWIDINTISFQYGGGSVSDLLAFINKYQKLLIYVIPYLNPSPIIIGNEIYYGDTLFFDVNTASIVGSTVVCKLNNNVNEYSLNFPLNPICNFPTDLKVDDVINIGKSHPNSLILESHLYTNQSLIVNVTEIMSQE